MEAIPRPKLTKIPGELPKLPAEKQIQDLGKLSKIQLLEIKEREEKLLAKFNLSKLPDKGERIKKFHQSVLKELSLRDEVERAAELFSDLNIASSGKDKLTNLEWTGKYDKDLVVAVVDSDDEEVDPLKIIAQSTSVKKKVQVIKDEPSLITEEDLKEIETFKEEEVVLDAELVEVDVKLMKTKKPATIEEPLEPHARYLIDKSVDHLPENEKFKPYRTTTSNCHKPEREMERKMPKKWEVTAATWPLLKHPGTKMLTLKDSVSIQTQYLSTLHALQKKQAEERLAAKAARLGAISLPDESIMKVSEFFRSYRDSPDDVETVDSSYIEGKAPDSDDDDEGVGDEEEDRRGVVTFTVHD